MRLFYSSRFHPLRQLLCRHNYSASSLEPVPRVAIVGSGPAGFYTAQQVLKVCVFNYELICDLIGSYHTMPCPSQQTPTKHTSYRENMSSSKLPHFSLTSWGTNFSHSGRATPSWPLTKAISSLFSAPFDGAFDQLQLIRTTLIFKLIFKKTLSGVQAVASHSWGAG